MPTVVIEFVSVCVDLRHLSGFVCVVVVGGGCFALDREPQRADARLCFLSKRRPTSILCHFAPQHSSRVMCVCVCLLCSSTPPHSRLPHSGAINNSTPSSLSSPPQQSSFPARFRWAINELLTSARAQWINVCRRTSTSRHALNKLYDMWFERLLTTTTTTTTLATLLVSTLWLWPLSLFSLYLCLALFLG